MNDITIFNSTDFGSVRTMEKDGEPYFCLSDICRCLDIKNVSDCKTRLKPDGATVSDVQTNGGMQKATFVNEGNLYRVIFQSKKPEAEKFTDWITEIVIPSIRKNGIFSVNQNLSPQLQLIQSMVNQMAQQELEIRKANEKSDKALETVSKMKDEILAPLGDWRKDVSDISRDTIIIQEFNDFDVMKVEFTKTQNPFNRIVVDYFAFGDITDFTMERKDMMSYPKSIKQELIKRVDVSCYFYNESKNGLETIISEEVEAADGDVVVYYLGNASYGFQAKFDGSESNVQILDYGAYFLKVLFKKSGKAQFEVAAYKYAIAEQYATKALNNRGKVVTWGNPLVGDMAMANDLSEWIGEYYNADIEYEYDSRGNPEMEANDVIYQENAYVEDMKVRVYRHTTNFNGGLSGKVVARRVSYNSA